MTADILIVDDEADIRDLISDILKDNNYTTRMAKDSDSALKSISETDPSAAGYVVEWLFFTLVALLPLAVALLLLLVAPERAGRLLERVRDWLIAHARTVASVIILILALALLRNGIAGLV